MSFSIAFSSGTMPRPLCMPMQPSDRAETVKAALPLPSVRFFVKIVPSAFLDVLSPALVFARAAETVLPIAIEPTPASTVDFRNSRLFIFLFLWLGCSCNKISLLILPLSTVLFGHGQFFMCMSISILQISPYLLVHGLYRFRYCLPLLPILGIK